MTPATLARTFHRRAAHVSAALINTPLQRNEVGPVVITAGASRGDPDRSQTANDCQPPRTTRAKFFQHFELVRVDRKCTGSLNRIFRRLRIQQARERQRNKRLALGCREPVERARCARLQKVVKRTHRLVAHHWFDQRLGAKVLGRRSVNVVPAEISLKAPTEAAPSDPVTVEWKGPNHPGDYLTIVARTAKDGIAAGVVYTTKGSPAKILAPKESGACEIRYMSGQNNVVLARAGILVR